MRSSLVWSNQMLKDTFRFSFLLGATCTPDILPAKVFTFRHRPSHILQQTQETLVPINIKTTYFQHYYFPHIHFITQPHFRRFQMAPGKNSHTTLNCFIYSGTVCVKGRAWSIKAVTFTCNSVCCQLDPNVFV